MSNGIRISLASAEKIAKEFCQQFVPQAIIAGSIRRKSPTIGDIDLMTKEPLKYIERMLLSNGIPVIVNGTKIIHAVYKNITINIYYYENGYEGAMLMFLTGPSGYNIGYRQRALRMGLKLNQYGLFDANGCKIAGETEESVYKALGKQFKEPSIRGVK